MPKRKRDSDEKTEDEPPAKKSNNEFWDLPALIPAADVITVVDKPTLQSNQNKPLVIAACTCGVWTTEDVHCPYNVLHALWADRTIRERSQTGRLTHRFPPKENYAVALDSGLRRLEAKAKQT